jgi:hypothetical protein
VNVGPITASGRIEGVATQRDAALLPVCGI